MLEYSLSLELLPDYGPYCAIALLRGQPLKPPLKFDEASEDSSYTQVYLYPMWRIWKNCCTHII